jgi:nucleoside-diphosphate-sugar epimerase
MMIETGYEVLGMDCDLYAQCTYGDEPLDVPEIRKDIRDITAGDFEGVEAVVHLAGLSNDALGDLDPDLTLEINTNATVLLAESAKKAGVNRFVFSSSCSIYGASGDDMIDENALEKPVTPYGQSKVLVEQKLNCLADDGFSPVHLRNATAYGFSPRIRFDLVLNNLVAWAYTTGRVHIKSDGTPWRPIVHVADIAQAMMLCLRAPREAIHCGIFNVGDTKENYQVRDLADIVKDVVPNTVIEYAEDCGPDSRCYRVSFEKLKNTIPDYRPAWNARLGAQELFEHYQKFGLSLDDFEGPRYRRISHIKRLIETDQLHEDLRWKVACS